MALATSAYLLWLSSRPSVLIDAGSGAMENLARAGADIRDLDALLDRAREAVPIVDGLTVRFPDRWEDMTALAADAHYAVGDYAAAAALAANAAARMNDVDLKSPVSGQVRLTLAAAEARLGHADRARRALEDFNAAVPAVRSITAIRKWIYRTDALADFEPFYAGLKLAGVPE